MQKKKFFKVYLLTTIITLVIGCGLYFLFAYGFQNGGLIGAIDGTGITGIILVSVGLLILITRDGFFDILAYGFKQTGSMIFSNKPNENNNFAEYKENKKVIRAKKSKYYLFIMLVGALFVTAFIILEFIFNTII